MRLIDTEEAKREEIYVGTFTRVITTALRASLALPAGSSNGEKDLVIKTLHSHAASLLSQNPHAAPGRAFRFLLGHEESVLLYDIESKVPQFPSQPEREKELERLQSMWAQQRTLDDARFAGAVDEWLRFHGGMLVGEVLFLATNAIKDGALSIDRFKHVFVDEYQDLTECEQVFVDLLRAPDGSMVVLGDDDQSIYGFRFNHPEGLAAFPQDDARRAEVEPILLRDNRRCAKRIVDLANEIAAEAGSSKEPMLKAKGEEGAIRFVRWNSLDDEINGLAEVMKAREDSFLVLVTRQFMGYRLKALLGDDAVTTFREQVLKVGFVLERFALASLLSNEDDAVAVRAWLAFNHEVPEHEGHRNVAAYQSATGSGRRGLGLLQAIADGSVEVSGEGLKNVRARAQQYIDFKARAPQHLDDLLTVLFDPSLVDNMPSRRVPQTETEAERNARERLDQQDREKARGDLDLILRSAKALVQTMEEPTLRKIVEVLRYRIGTQAPLLDEDREPRIRIMTLHGAKGLQEGTVVVCGLASEMIPGPPKIDPLDNAKHEKEQRHLLYVAVTRAEDELVLSWSDWIPSSHTRRNGVVQHPNGITINGVYHTRLTRTRLLPPRAETPERGSDWRNAQVRTAEARRSPPTM